MLLTFRGYNARSFRDPFELSLLSTRLSEPGVPHEIEWREDGRPIGVLPSAGIFGANASGKSNLLRAMSDMRRLVLTSFRGNTPDGPVETHPSCWATTKEGRRPATRSSWCSMGYGTITASSSMSKVCARSGRAAIRTAGRWLFYSEAASGSTSARGSGPKAVRSQEILRPNALFLSTAAAINHPLFLPLFHWFQRNLSYADVGAARIDR